MFEFDHIDAFSELDIYAKKFKLEIQNNFMYYPKSKNNGFMYREKIYQDINCLLLDVEMNESFHYKRLKSQIKNQISIMLFMFYKNDGSYLQVSDRKFVLEHKTQPIAFFTSNFHDIEIYHSAGCEIKGILITISDEWLKDNLPSEAYIQNVKDLYNIPITIKTLHQKNVEIFKELFSFRNDLSFSDIFLKKNIYEIVYRVLQILSKPKELSVKESISQIDQENLRRVHNYLSSNIQEEFLGVPALAKMAFMSESKLKKLYKSLYGVTLYDGFLSLRMQQAKLWLEKKDMSITQIGRRFKYQNLSNFTNAFKKEFGILPSEVGHDLIE